MGNVQRKGRSDKRGQRAEVSTRHFHRATTEHHRTTGQLSEADRLAWAAYRARQLADVERRRTPMQVLG